VLAGSCPRVAAVCGSGAIFTPGDAADGRRRVLWSFVYNPTSGW
jgi:hypothetical protein